MRGEKEKKYTRRKNEGRRNVETNKKHGNK
jgi:hypothetical protein